MAELHILGHLQGATNFQDKSSLFCRYSFQHGAYSLWFSSHLCLPVSKCVISIIGPNWTVISGCPEGQTVAGKPDYNKSIIWTQPLDVHFITRGIQGEGKWCNNCFNLQLLTIYSLPACDTFRLAKIDIPSFLSWCIWACLGSWLWSLQLTICPRSSYIASALLDSVCHHTDW